MKNKYLNVLCFGFLGLLFLGCQREKSPNPDGSTDRKSATQTSIPPLRASTEPPSNDDVTRPGMRGPTQKHPTLVAQPEVPNPIAKRLSHEIDSANGDVAVLALNFTSLWNEGITGLPTTALPSSNNTEIARGARLPREIEPVLRKNATPVGAETAEALVCGVAMWSALRCNDLLAKFAQLRANTLPPSAADITIYEALNAAIRELSQTRGSDSYASFEPWEQFSSAANPIYRLLALRAAPYTVSRAAWNVSPESDDFNRIDASAKLGFYLKFLDEKDPIILTEAIRTLATVPLPEARETIAKFRATQIEYGDAALIQAAEDALRTQDILSKGSR